ncbi:hypothetical protein JCM17823_12680 [Halorubrum gandharaense]
MDDASTRSDAGDSRDAADAAEPSSDGAESADSGDAELDALREQVESEYDFDDFGPEDMARMSPEEWDAAFDPETWITGERLLDRVEAELKTRISRREVFGVLERVRDADGERVVVYSDEGYAVVRPSGEITGEGTVLRDVEPVVALAAMEEYEVSEPPDDWSLPDPDSVPQGSGEFGNWMLQIVAAVQLVAGLALLAGWLFFGVDTIVAPAAALFFLLIGVFLFAMVANARLSDRFRAEEYRERLRALREAERRPEFVPIDDDAESVLTDDAERPSASDERDENGSAPGRKGDERDAR